MSQGTRLSRESYRFLLPTQNSEFVRHLRIGYPFRKGTLAMNAGQFVQSKRNIASVVALLGIAWQIYQLISSGQPIPNELVMSAVAIVSAWIVGDSIRPTMPKE
jgi:hypothetical protein